MSPPGYKHHSSCEFTPLVHHLEDTRNVREDGQKARNGYGSGKPIRCIDPETLEDDGPLKVESCEGEKSIGMLGSISIAVNSLAGPAMLTLPATYQKSGLIPTTLTLVLVCVLSAFCSLHVANVVSKVPGNRTFGKKIEFSDPFRIFMGEKAFMFTQVTFFLCTVCLNVASIVDTAQVVDTFLGHSMGSFAIRFDSLPLEFVTWRHGECTRAEVRAGGCLPFGNPEDGTMILTAGYLFAAAMFLPICLMDLKENAGYQIFGFCVLLVNSLQFAVSFMMNGLDFSNVTLWGDSWDTMLGVILFNFSLVVAVPAWLHDKCDNVDVPTVVHRSSYIATGLYILVGSLGALSIPNVSPNVLEAMVSGAFGLFMRLGASFFAFIIIGLDIPLFSVLTRYNLAGSGLCSDTMVNLLVVYLPWAVSWMFYQGNGIDELLSWGGVLFTSVVAFILPLLLALHTLLNYDQEGTIAVYGRWVKSKQGQTAALYALLLCTTFAVGIAFGGQSKL